MINNNSDPEKHKFLYPFGNYQGKFTPENLIFNANLQEFAQKVSFICGLEANNKISPLEAYEQIRELWEKVPDWRLGQIIVNAVGPSESCPELFQIEDTDLQLALPAFPSRSRNGLRADCLFNQRAESRVSMPNSRVSSI